MPYEIRKRGSKWCVVGPNRVHGCHDSRAKAIRQQRALYRNAPESADGGVTMSDVKTDEVELPGVTAAQAAVAMTRLASTGITISTSPGTGTWVAPAVWNGWTSNTTLADAPLAKGDDKREPWSGILGTEWSPTDDGRLLERDKIGHRDLPVPFRVQIQDDEGHKGAFNCGRIESISRIPVEEFAKRPDADDFDLSGIREDAIIIYGEGTLDGSPYASEAKRILANGSGVSLDGLRFSGNLFNAEDLSEVEEGSMDMGELFEALMSGSLLQGIHGDIAGVTVVDVPAFQEAKVLVASAQLRFGAELTGVLSQDPEKLWYFVGPTSTMEMTAAAGPVKPPAEWFADPRLTELTPLTITPEGRVYGHLADWDGCHVGFQGVCMPPFRSYSEFAYFNTGSIETSDGEFVPCGKIMFCMEGNGHAPVDENLAYDEIQRYYDDATKVGAFVRAGSDPFGTYLVGALRPGLSDIEIQHLRTHPPSGDWRPIKNGPSELIAAFAVPVGGFPIPRRAMVASADGAISAIITAPLQLSDDWRKRKRRKAMLSERLQAALGHAPRSTREQMRVEAIRRLNDLD